MSAVKPQSLCASDGEELLRIIFRRLDQWMQVHYARVTALLFKFDTDGDNRLSREDLVVGLRMMEVRALVTGRVCMYPAPPTSTQVPLTKAETDMVLNVLDTDSNGIVDISEFNQMIRHHHQRLQSEKLSREASIMSDEEDEPSVCLRLSPSRLSTPCPHCHIGKAEPTTDQAPRYPACVVVNADL